MGQPDDIAEMRAMIEAISRKLDAVIMQPRPEWVTVNEYAEICSVNPRTVRNWISNGELETYRNGSKTMIRANQAVSRDRRRSHYNRRSTG